MNRIRKAKRKFGYQPFYEIDNLFEELGTRRARVTIDMGRISKIEPHLTNVVVFGISLVRNYDELYDFRDRDFLNKFVQKMGVFYGYFLQNDAIDMALNFDKYLIDKKIICSAYISNLDKWKAKAKFIGGTDD